QQLTLETGNLLTLENGGVPINLTPFLDNTDNQQLTLTGNNLTLEDGGAATSLVPYLDNTDEQTISDFTFDDTTNILTLTITGGNTDTADLSALAGGGTPSAADVTFAPYLSLLSTNTQAAIAELKDELDANIIS